jgi:hypothetical protein
MTCLVKRKGLWILGTSHQRLIASVIVTCDNVFVMGAASIETPNSTYLMALGSSVQSVRTKNCVDNIG